jgi:hypothetical protein
MNEFHLPMDHFEGNNPLTIYYAKSAVRESRLEEKLEAHENASRTMSRLGDNITISALKIPE